MTVAQKHLSKLLCGTLLDTQDSDIDDILKHISSLIDKVEGEISELEQLTDDKRMLYGPYLGRSLLELGSTALIARLDPFRAMIVREKQKRPDYLIHVPHKSSIRWQGDILSEPVGDLWVDKNLQSPTRAILGDYFKEMFFIKSAQTILDNTTEELVGDWYNKLQRTDPVGLMADIRTSYSKLFSSLSKGVHHEMIVPAGTVYDKDTVNQLINETLYYVSTLALVAAPISFIYNKMNLDDVYSYYKSVQELEVV